MAQVIVYTRYKDYSNVWSYYLIDMIDAWCNHSKVNSKRCSCNAYCYQVTLSVGWTLRGTTNCYYMVKTIHQLPLHSGETCHLYTSLIEINKNPKCVWHKFNLQLQCQQFPNTNVTLFHNVPFSAAEYWNTQIHLNKDILYFGYKVGYTNSSL